MTFVQAFALFPIVQAAHVWEEWPGFPKWARRFASDRYTDRQYIVTHAVAIASAIAVVLVVRTFPARSVVFLAFAFAFGPGIGCNAVFHLGATVISRQYCPGAVTSIVLYFPLTLWLMVLALREDLMSPTTAMIALAIAGVFHAVEVGHNVFKRW
jgi:uncharacterized membrane protein YoaK (UPF0700 family)